ncbi:MAG: hypothetical protein ACLP1X_07935 [Polyangiaceae bacterium]
MKDPEADDTEPTGCLDAGTEDTDPQGHPEMGTDVGVPEGLEAGSSEEDTDDFLRWLPTMSLGHRRRSELVKRPSSDGADFAVYACEGRPAAASERPRPEAAVQVQITPPPGLGALARGERARGASADERDAPTVVTRRRTGWRAVLVGAAGVVGLVAAGAAIVGRTLRPPAIAQTLLPAAASETPSAPMADRIDRPGPGDSTPAPPAAQERTQSAMPSLARTPAGPRASVSSASARPVHKRDAAEGRTGIDAPAKIRAAPLATASAVPLKDQYFEEP